MATDIATKELNAQPIAENLTKSEIDKIDKYHDNKVSKFYLVVKRFIDIIGGFVGCIMMIPISIVIYILNLINNENEPMFYKWMYYDDTYFNSYIHIKYNKQRKWTYVL